MLRLKLGLTWPQPDAMVTHSRIGCVSSFHSLSSESVIVWRLFREEIHHPRLQSTSPSTSLVRFCSANFGEAQQQTSRHQKNANDNFEEQLLRLPSDSLGCPWLLEFQAIPGIRENHPHRYDMFDSDTLRFVLAANYWNKILQQKQIVES